MKTEDEVLGHLASLEISYPRLLYIEGRLTNVAQSQELPSDHAGISMLGIAATLLAAAAGLRMAMTEPPPPEYAGQTADLTMVSQLLQTIEEVEKLMAMTSDLLADAAEGGREHMKDGAS